MIAKIIAWCAGNRLVTLLLVGLLTAWGVISLRSTALDAVPDLSDVQVTVFSEWMGRAPDLVEDNITYPIVSSLLGAPRVTAVRGQSMFGMSFVNIIFEDGTDLYWARSRVLEKLSSISNRLPQGVTPILGPDATGVGWVFEYALVDKTGRTTLQQLQSIQDWNIRYALQAVPGVAEVASVGGFVKEYQIALDPDRLASLGIPLKAVVNAVRMSNADVGGRVLEVSGTEHYVRGRGYVKTPADLEKVVLASHMGTPVLLRDVGTVRLGPAQRRGLADLDGEGETVGGVVIARSGTNALEVIDAVKTRIADLTSTLPPGVQIIPTYDRSGLIRASIHTLKHTLIEELIVVTLVILVFLLHFRSTLIPVLLLPIAVVLAFIPMKQMGLTANIMSLGGIAIAIGAMVGPAHLLLAARHHRRLLARFYARRHRGPALCAAGLDQDVLDGVRRAALHHARPGDRSDVHPRKDPRRGSQSHQPYPWPAVRTRLPLRVALSLVGDRWCAGADGGHGAHREASRQRVHAAAQRRHTSLHAHERSWHERRNGAGCAAADGPGFEAVPGGGARLR
jgi:Cu(I)/Ag(I) efflux system membrane protein CusA/SilA